MATITQNITIDVARANVFDAVIGKQYDEDSRFLKCSITQEGEPLTIPSGSSIAINAKRPDGTMGSFAGTRGADGTAIVPISSWILEQNGMVNLSVSIVGSGGEKLTSCTFYLNVQEAEGEGYILVYTAPSSVATGTYYITLGGVSYQFDLTTALATGDKIYFSSTYATGKTVDGSDGSTIETLMLAEGTSGTELVGSDVINFLASFMANIAELGNKADKVGKSPDLVAGTAEQMIGEEFIDNKVPYSFRQTPGSGKRLDEEVVGGTVGWNQLVQDGNFPDDTKWIATGTGAVLTVANNKATMHRDSATSVTITLALGTSYRPQSVSGHKYLFAATIETASGQINFIPTGSTTDGTMGYITLAAKTRVGYIWPCSVDKPMQGTVRGYTGLGVTSAIDYTVEDYICVDLTLALGSTIADYLYTLESNTPGAGVAKFRELFPKDYYAYCEPTLQSVCVSKHIEANSDSTEINEYPLEAVELRGVLKLDGNNNIYADGDTYEGDGTVTRRYGIVDLGSLTWSYGDGRFQTPKSGITPEPSATGGVVCSQYSYSSSEAIDKTIVQTASYYRIYDSSYTDAATFKTAMSGVYLVYELATPTTESAAPYPSLQHCSGGGTEEYVDYLVGQGTRDVSIPAGHNSKYYPDLTQRISDIPEPPSGDGTYTLKCTVSSGVRTFAWV